MYQDNFLQQKIDERIAANALRTLRKSSNNIDFCSNDYLGIAKRNLLVNSPELFANNPGSTGSRLLAGNYHLLEETEEIIANFHNAEAALLYNSGYDANIGLLSAVLQKQDVIIYDQLVHASIRDGISLSKAQSFSFRHNDVVDAEKKLQHATLNLQGQLFIITESVFSMDGDICPLPAIVALAQQYHAHIIIDEAHATGVIGNRGEGLVQMLDLQQKIFARVHTFGKACGCHGAVVLGSALLRSYLINFSRSLIYSTSLPPAAVGVIKKSYEIFPNMVTERSLLQSLIRLFQNTPIRYQKLFSDTPIQVVIIPDNSLVKLVADQLQLAGFDVRPILYPTVPKGAERLRIILHAYNTEQEVLGLLKILQQ